MSTPGTQPQNDGDSGIILTGLSLPYPVTLAYSRVMKSMKAKKKEKRKKGRKERNRKEENKKRKNLLFLPR